MSYRLTQYSRRVGDFSVTLLAVNRSSYQKRKRETPELNDILDQMDLTVIYRAFQPKIQNTHYSQCGTQWSKARNQ